MPRPSYASTLLRGWEYVALFALAGLILSVGVSFVEPMKYSSTVRLLVMQDVGASVDAFTASRSEERIAENLATIVYTTTFFDRVLDAGFAIDARYFPTQDNRRRRAWTRTVTPTVSRGSGILTVTAFHPDVRQAELIAQAVGFVLRERVGEYTSGGNVQVRLIDAPLNSRWPVRPNFVANGLSGFFLGGFVGAGYVLLRAERVRRRHQLLHEDD